MDNRNLKIFKNIVKFVEDLSCVYGEKQYSLLLYGRLLNQTDPSNTVHHNSVIKHINAFNKFITNNREAIINQNSKEIKDPVISYSKKANIKMQEIFRLADESSSKNIWKHLLVITNSIDPNSKAMEVLKKTMNEKSNEGDFLNDLVQKIEKNVDPNTNDPMSAITSLMSSGIFTELLGSMSSGMKDGKLNIGKLLNTVQTLASSLGEELDQDGNPKIEEVSVEEKI